MSYEPTTWRTGDVVTSAKLNKLEQGVADAGGGGVTIVHVELPRGAWDMTAGEAFAAAQTGLVILVESVAGVGIVGAGPISMGIDEDWHYITTTSVSNATYGALTADDYPTVGGNSGGGV